MRYALIRKDNQECLYVSTKAMSDKEALDEYASKLGLDNIGQLRDRGSIGEEDISVFSSEILKSDIKGYFSYQVDSGSTYEVHHFIIWENELYFVKTRKEVVDCCKKRMLYRAVDPSEFKRADEIPDIVREKFEEMRGAV